MLANIVIYWHVCPPIHEHTERRVEQYSHQRERESHSLVPSPSLITIPAPPPMGLVEESYQSLNLIHIGLILGIVN